MTGEEQLTTSNVDRVIEAIREADPAEKSATTLVAIDGFGGSGKSTTAEAAARELGAHIVHTDDFSSWEEPIDWWPRALEECILPLAEGRTAKFRRYDWAERALTDEVEVPAGGLVIIEGVSSSRREFAPYLAMSVWVDAPHLVRLNRGLERDGEEAAPLWERWMAEEDAWAERDGAKNRAAIILHTAN